MQDENNLGVSEQQSINAQAENKNNKPKFKFVLVFIIFLSLLAGVAYVLWLNDNDSKLAETSLPVEQSNSQITVDAEIRIGNDNKVIPETVQVDPGTTIAWVNESSENVTLKLDKTSQSDDGFGTGDEPLEKGSLYTYQFSSSGTYIVLVNKTKTTIVVR